MRRFVQMAASDDATARQYFTMLLHNLAANQANKGEKWREKGAKKGRRDRSRGAIDAKKERGSELENPKIQLSFATLTTLSFSLFSLSLIPLPSLSLPTLPLVLLSLSLCFSLSLSHSADVLCVDEVLDALNTVLEPNCPQTRDCVRHGLMFLFHICRDKTTRRLVG